MELKLRLCWAIVKNLGRLLSFDFWYQAVCNRHFPARLFVRMILVSAALDIALMLLKPEYPSSAD